MVLTFTSAQFNQLNDIADSAFETRLVRALARAMENVPGRPDETGLLELTQKSRLRAAALGIGAERDQGDVAVFALFAIASSGLEASELTQFQQWVTPSLRRESSPGAVKVALAEQMLRAQAGQHSLAARLCEMAAEVRAAMSA